MHDLLEAQRVRVPHSRGVEILLTFDGRTWQRQAVHQGRPSGDPTRHTPRDIWEDLRSGWTRERAVAIDPSGADVHGLTRDAGES
jgi:hypothetical protein